MDFLPLNSDFQLIKSRPLITMATEDRHRRLSLRGWYWLNSSDSSFNDVHFGLPGTSCFRPISRATDAPILRFIVTELG